LRLYFSLILEPYIIVSNSIMKMYWISSSTIWILLQRSKCNGQSWNNKRPLLHPNTSRSTSIVSKKKNNKIMIKYCVYLFYFVSFYFIFPFLASFNCDSDLNKGSNFRFSSISSVVSTGFKSSVDELLKVKQYKY
jgi:hypothetical protein